MLTNIEQRAYEAHVSMCHDVSNHLTKRDWEQRRYEIAKDIYCKYLTEIKDLPSKDLAELSVHRADELIEALKK